MKFIIEVNYRAPEGEALYLVGSRARQMVLRGEDLWRVELTARDSFDYHFELRRGTKTLISECGAEHRAEYVSGVDTYYIKDFWRGERVSKPLNSSLFTKAVFRRDSPEAIEIEAEQTILECRAESIRSGEVLAVVGASAELGAWDAQRARVMSDSEFPLWRVALPRVVAHTEYKYVILEKESGEVVSWEMGENRMIEPNNSLQGRVLHKVSDLTPKFDRAAWRGLGVAIPIFSLRTSRSMGVGDFGDLRSMVDWAAEREMSVIQILPINDTTMGGTWMDSYPYNANSTFALHPQYLALREAGEIADERLREEFERRAAEIDALDKIDYPAVAQLKREYMRELFTQQRSSTIRTKEYRNFVEQNAWWLEPYALFSLLRDQYETPEFERWGEDAIYNEKLLKRHKRDKETLREMEYNYFVQYHLHRQLTAATTYARERGVALKGDIPIGISRTSVDAWIYPELFNMSSQAGAPPDPFSDLGQNWGFPTYNWERMAEDNFTWWRARFEKMAEYFDAYRIDHILGFFRIWEIPMGSIHGLTGQFNPALPLSVKEIKAAGLPFESYFTEPYVTDSVLSEIFETFEVEAIKEQYFEAAEGGRYRFKAQYDTQRKIKAEVADEALCEALMLLHNEVLFVEDAHKAGHYHPRIMTSWSRVYKALPEPFRRSMDRLHDDFYYSRHNEFWRESAMQKLPTLISSTNMLVCGEDLGMIPACVADVMASEQILSLEIERMPKAMGVPFANPADYPYLSVCTTSTHDMATIRGWWREDQELSQRYFNEALGKDGLAPEECSGELAREILERHTKSPAMLTILPWQDWMACDESQRRADVDAERINVPANSRHYWRYRMHIKL